MKLRALHISNARMQITGSSTACIAALDSHSEMLQAINIGDSGLYVFSEAQKTEMAGTMKREARKEGMHITYRFVYHRFDESLLLYSAPDYSTP